MLRKSRFKNRRKSDSLVNDQTAKYADTYWERDVELESGTEEQMYAVGEWNCKFKSWS